MSYTENHTENGMGNWQWTLALANHLRAKHGPRNIAEPQ